MVENSAAAAMPAVSAFIEFSMPAFAPLRRFIILYFPLALHCFESERVHRRIRFITVLCRRSPKSSSRHSREVVGAGARRAIVSVQQLGSFSFCYAER